MEIARNIAISVAASLATFALIKAYLDYLDKKKASAGIDINKFNTKTDRENQHCESNDLKKLTLLEKELLSCIFDPRSLEVEPADLFGLESVYADLVRRALFPIIYPSIYSTTLLSPSLGVLLYGPPGTGKTMLTKAIARTCDCRIMIITAADVMDKYIGNPENRVHAIFSLAKKLEPCIVFIDEVDSLFTARGELFEHEASRRVKLTFMQHWDGIATKKPSQILVVGTTNREHDIDSAVLRRFDIKVQIPLPNVEQRARIIKGYLMKHVNESENGVEAFAPCILSEERMGEEDDRTLIDWLVESTEGFSGSDLQQLCSYAVKRPVNEAIVENK